jgi:undecaprenyl-diphosphatase
MSWSKKIFLQINKKVGINKKIDLFMYFCAHVLVYWLIGLVLSWGAFVLYEIDIDKFSLLLKLLLTASFFAFVFNYLLALVWKHPRPILDLENKNIKVLLKTLYNWKSFPSDHTTISFIFVFVPFFLGINFYFFFFLLFLASLISFSRIYVGVHYPRDILGGFLVGLFFSVLSFWFLENITQVIYNYFNSLFF